MVTPLTDGQSMVTRNGSSATVTTRASPGGDTLHVSAGVTVTTPMSANSATVQIAAASVGATTSFDASGLLPPLTSYTYAHPTLSWTGGDGSGTLILIEATMHVGPAASGLDWIVYADPAATEVTFPTLPDELGVSTPIDIYAMAITKLDVPGESAVSIARTLDRTIRHWPNYDYVVPPLGNAMTRLTYSAF
jgi:hypothetical protein